MSDGILLRPAYLGPKGGKGPLQFGKDPSAKEPQKKTAASFVPTSEYNARERTGDRIRFTFNELLDHRENNMNPPPGLLATNSELLLIRYQGDQAVSASDFARARFEDRTTGRWRQRDTEGGDGEEQQPESGPGRGTGPGRGQPSGGTGRGGDPRGGRGGPQGGPRGPNQYIPPEDLPELQTAEERGATAWRRGKTQTDSDVAASVKAAKGILNKLTPEKFDRLLQQIFELCESTEVVRQLIPVVFEKAVAEPAFCNLYAQLCEKLNVMLGPLDNGQGGKKLDFKKLLLNTCQDEFQAILSGREADKGRSADSDEHRQFKMRTLGTVRLLGELYNHKMLSENVLKRVFNPLLDPNDFSQFTAANEVSIEAACQLLNIAGKALDAEEKTRAFLNAYLDALLSHATDRQLTSRLRFLLQDVAEVRSNAWKARKEIYTAKKIDDVRKEAFESLNIEVPAQMPGSAPMGGGTGPGLDFPDLDEGDMGGAHGPAYQWGTRGVDKTDEELRGMVTNLYNEYLMHGRVEETLADWYELGRPDKQQLLVATGLQVLMDQTAAEKQQGSVVLLVTLINMGAAEEPAVVAGFREFTDTLHDLCIDVPRAPEQLGTAFGATFGQQLLSPQSVGQILAGIQETEPRQRYFKSAITKTREDVGPEYTDQLLAAVASGGVNFVELFTPDPEFEQHVPSANVFMAEVGVAVPPAQ